MTITGTEACEAMRAHHQVLTEQLSTRVAAVSEAVAAGRPVETAVAEVIAYLAEEVLPHAAAEEDTVYVAAAGYDDLTGTVDEMLAEHQTLAAAAEALAGAADGRTAAEQATHIAELFTDHAARENDVLLPALLASSEIDLAALLTQLHARAEQAVKPPPPVSPPRPDSQAAVLGILLQAATALARGGQADLACRLAAAAWAALRQDRPDLTTHVTAALHGLARRVNREPVPAPGSPGDAGKPPGAPATVPVLDVRELAPAQRHEAIFAAHHELAPGAGFVLVNDHDPKPLGYQFEAEHSGQFSWESLEAGPEVWRIRIGRPSAPGSRRPAEAGPGGTARDGEGGEPDLDVRQAAHFKRHDMIFAAYQALRPGAGFVLVNDHDPLPLRYQFEAQYLGEFTWDYQESGPKTWRIRIGRAIA